MPCSFYGSIYLSFFLILAVGDWMSTILPHMVWHCGFSANLQCLSEMCGTRLAANTGRKKSTFGTVAQLCRAVFFAAKACIDNRKKNLLNTDTSSTCPHNMVNFGLLTAKICWRVWGTPANFNGFRILAALLHGTLVVGVSQTAALNRGRHL